MRLQIARNCVLFRPYGPFAIDFCALSELEAE